MDGRKGGWMDERVGVSGWLSGWMDGWMDE